MGSELVGVNHSQTYTYADNIALHPLVSIQDHKTETFFLSADIQVDTMGERMAHIYPLKVLYKIKL
jgi:hypothetical protein